MELVSGDVNKGVLRLDTGYAYCYNSENSINDWENRFSSSLLKAKVSLMNKWGQVTSKEIEL